MDMLGRVEPDQAQCRSGRRSQAEGFEKITARNGHKSSSSGSWFRFPLLQIPLLRLLQKIFRRPPGKRQDRERWVLVGAGDEGGSIGDEQVFHIVRLAIFVQRRDLGIIS